MTASDKAPQAWQFPFCPQSPDWRLDWGGIEAAFAPVRNLGGCPQDPIHHAEGDVLIHTRMVCEALCESPAWRGLAAEERSIVFAATLLHDIAKPACTKEEQGRITSRGHALKGTYTARSLFWELWPDAASPQLFQAREAVAALIRHHGLPLYFLDRPDPLRSVIEASVTARLDWVAMLAEADVRGRVCSDQAELLERVALFQEFAAESQCLSGPFPFASDHSRLSYFRKADLPATALLHDDTRCEAILMSGLPASGKDAWLAHAANRLPAISLDLLREELEVSPTDDQGQLASEARERARICLRQGQSFVWNGTNTSRLLRRQLIDLFADYRARVRIVYVETSSRELERRNRRRGDPVPQRVIDRLRSRIDIPDLSEAHALEIVIT